jgi:hypothetical protein
MFSSSSFKVLGLTLKSLFHFELIFVQGKKYGSSFSLLCGYLVFVAPLVEKGVFSPLYILVTCVKN